MFLIAFGCAVIAYAATFLLKVRYLATESLYFVQNPETSPLSFASQQQDKSSGDVSLAGGALSSPLVGAKIQTAIGILDSRGCAAYIVSNLGMAQHYGISEEKAIETVRLRLRADTDKDGFVKVDFDDPSKQTAVAVLQAAQEYLGSMSEKLSLNLSEKNRRFMEKELLDARKALHAKSRAFALISGQNPSADIELLAKNYIDIVKELDEADDDIAAGKAQIADSERLYRKVLLNAMSFPGRIVALGVLYKDLSFLADGLQRRQVALVDAAVKYNPNTPDLQSIRQDDQNMTRIVDELVGEQKKDLNEDALPVLAEAHAKLASLEATAAHYRALLPSLKRQYSASANDAANVEAAKRDLTSAEEHVTRLETELLQSKIAEERNPERFELVDPPYATGEVAFPKRSLIAFGVFVVVLAVLLVFRSAPATSRS